MASLFSLANGVPLEPTPETLQRYWGQLHYRGYDLIDSYTDYLPYQGGREAGQECYLGYHPEEDLFYVGFEGACLAVVSIDDKGRLTEYEVMWSDEDELFYQRGGMFETAADIPGLIDLRLD